MLAKEQYIGTAVLFGIALFTWLFMALWPQPQKPIQMDSLIAADSLRAVRDSLRRDSIRAARDAWWEHYKDSTRHVDHVRFALWAKNRQLSYDSARLADSLWKDSVGWNLPKRIKKDTILDLNHTDTTELQWIRGIGSYKASHIIRYREELGGYYSPTQLTDEALADLHLDTLLQHFIANPKDIRPIDVNHCNTDQLYRHPYLRYNQAKAIYELRRKYIRLQTIEQLRELPEFSEEDIDRLRPYFTFTE